eukprot:Pgem_evm1s10281
MAGKPISEVLDTVGINHKNSQQCNDGTGISTATSSTPTTTPTTTSITDHHSVTSI